MGFKKYIPQFLINYYHFLLAFLSAFWHWFPSRKIKVIGITGTQGKSTTVSLTGRILEEAGFGVGWISSLDLKIAKKEWLNPYHMTMPGRFFIQSFLRQALRGDCQYCLIEVTSEGILQHRHRFIDFDVAVFTNLAPEHIERHGSFENYRKAKMKLFEGLDGSQRKLIAGQRTKKIIIVNLDDKNAQYFLEPPADEKWGYRVVSSIPEAEQVRYGAGKYQVSSIEDLKILEVRDYQVLPEGVRFSVGNVEFNLNLLGEFNIYNSLAAISVALSQGVDLATCKRALEKVKGMLGRMEEVSEDQDFRVFVDLAHTPGSFEQVFSFTKNLAQGRVISVFGAAGGGRDKWKRPELGKVAAKNSDFIILCNEDPYNEEPTEIIQDIKKGIEDSGFDMKNCLEIEDRREAIRKGLGLAQKGDIVLVLGKGTEQTLVMGKETLKWDDREVVREELRKVIGN